MVNAKRNVPGKHPTGLRLEHDHAYHLLLVISYCFLPVRRIAGTMRAMVHMRSLFWLAPVTSVGLSFTSLYGQVATLDHPVSIAVAVDTGHIFVVNEGTARIDVFDSRGVKQRSIQGTWTGLCDLDVSADGQSVTAISQSPPQMTLIRKALDPNPTMLSVDLPGYPSRVLQCDQGRIVCITMPWKRGVCIVEVPESPTKESLSLRTMPITFPPKELVSWDSDSVLIADAFGDQLAVISLKEKNVASSHRILGYHIAGLAVDAARNTLLVTHQRLSRHAETSLDDIHWGNLIQNRVTEIDIASLQGGATVESKRFRSLSLDDTGHGAADPAGVVADRGEYVVAISGTNQVAYRIPASQTRNSNDQTQWRFVDAGVRPTRVVRIENRRFACLNAGEGTISIFECSDSDCKLVNRIGEPRLPKNAGERGEQYFFSSKQSHDGWMSCSSCHIDGHSPDLLVDTLGDGNFGNAKRIPSLFHVGSTGPWGWRGNQPTLSSQIESTLKGTMHRLDNAHASAATNSEIANDIVQYLQQLAPPRDIPLMMTVENIGQPIHGQSIQPSFDAAEIERGSVRFAEFGCAKCHDPSENYTTPSTYLLNNKQTSAHEEFNPPTLRGVAHRRRYFHDGRFESLEALLRHHPAPDSSRTEESMRELLSFLWSL